MKNKKLLAALLAALLLVGSFAACAPAAAEPAATQAPTETAQAPAEETTQASAGVTVTDMMGREISLDQPATRVIALSAADCEVLFAVGAGDLLAGRGEYCD